MVEPSELVLLTKTTSALETALLKSSLEGAGFQVVVRNAGLSSVDPRMAMLSQQELHVRQRDLEAARALLTEGAVVPADALGDGSLLGTCPLHERPARAQCGRCGTFLCERCQTAHTPPVCEDCVAQAAQTPARPARRGLQRAVAVLLLLPTGLTLLGLLALALRRLFSS